jgi:hypothetical protein
MKLRLGFVSNSSSSSFIIAYKGNKKKLLENVIKAFELPESFPIKISSKDYASVLVNSIDDTYTTLGSYVDYCNNEENDVDKKIADLLKKDFIVSIGSVCDESDSLEAFLCDADINYTSDELVIEKEGGY